MSIEIKICGFTNADDLKAAADLGVEYVGFVIFPGSPRCISPVMLSRIVEKSGCQARRIGVFVNEGREFVERIARDCGLHAVQLHGDEPPEAYADFPVRVWRAAWFKEEAFVPNPTKWKVDRFVYDATVMGKYGGTGRTADWGKASEFARAYPTMLAGGLEAGNVADAIATVRPIGVDAVSSLEVVPGRKDREKMKKFVEAVRRVDVSGSMSAVPTGGAAQ